MTRHPIGTRVTFVVPQAGLGQRAKFYADATSGIPKFRAVAGTCKGPDGSEGAHHWTPHCEPVWMKADSGKVLDS